MNDGKKRHVVSYENMKPDVAEAFATKYPGVNDCIDDLVKYPKPDGTSFYAVTVETADGIYLVKIKVDVDNIDDLERWLDGEDGSIGGDSGTDDGQTLPDDNINQYGGGDDESADGDA